MFKFFGKFRHLLGLAALVFGLVSVQHTAYGQGNATCRVKVVDEIGPLPGAAVVVKGTSIGHKR